MRSGLPKKEGIDLGMEYAKLPAPALLAGVTALGYAYTSSRARCLIPFSLVFLALALYAYGVAQLTDRHARRRHRRDDRPPPVRRGAVNCRERPQR
ncbi:hypothetical protein ACFV4Q_06410 [Streptomyces nojiriensis]|uniref:hypothetical protein n=1 Tax=Streptomyces nojiriensis TaxID=66374 RepID=UPI0036499E16